MCQQDINFLLGGEMSYSYSVFLLQDAFLEQFSEPTGDGPNLWQGLLVTAMGLATLVSVIATK